MIRIIFSSTFALVLLKLITTLKEMYLASEFGISWELDAFALGFSFQAIVVAAYALPLRPCAVKVYFEVLSKTQEKSEAKLKLWFSALEFAAYSCVLSTILALGAKTLILWLKPEVDLEVLKATVLTVQITAFSIPFQVISQTLGGVLIAEKRMFPLHFAPVTTALCIIGLIAFWGGDALMLSIGWLIGCIMETMLIMFLVRPSRLRTGLADRSVTKSLWMLTYPMMASSLIMAGTTTVDQAMGFQLDSGSLSALNYANRLSSVILTILSGSLAYAVLHHLASIAASGTAQEIRSSARSISLISFLVIVPVALFLGIFAKEIVGLIYMRGQFTEMDLNRVVPIFQAYLFQYPFYILSTVQNQLAVARGQTRLLGVLAILSFLLNVLLNFVFIEKFGVMGIAIATSVVYATNWFLVMVYFTYYDRSQPTPSSEA
ncbi:MAG: polysaccharide biosynthesis C-terminal domain-containing protein [Candidatus Cloacimonetes bacterium]|nr:polysaccharide biosynthesis C-terminal domain-containing protein [Candidatus Cloacimonadota bacterium]